MPETKNQFSIEPFQEKVIKPWGEETLYAPASLPYIGKILFVKSGKRLSLQTHNKKKETLCLFSGSALLWLENKDGDIEKVPMVPFYGYTIIPHQKHRIEAIENSYILEASTPEIGDTVRIEDDYSRPTETEEMRKQKNRGWKGDE
jgi:mannose-6-phosphate isomerase